MITSMIEGSCRLLFDIKGAKKVWKNWKKEKLKFDENNKWRKHVFGWEINFKQDPIFFENLRFKFFHLWNTVLETVSFTPPPPPHATTSNPIPTHQLMLKQPVLILSVLHQLYPLCGCRPLYVNIFGNLDSALGPRPTFKQQCHFLLNSLN